MLDPLPGSNHASAPLLRVNSRCIAEKESMSDLHSQQNMHPHTRKEDAKRDSKPQLQLPIREKLFEKG
jgi:hypothetical protein